MRVSAILLAAAIMAAPAFSDTKKEVTGPVYEPNTYRFGGTYSASPSHSASQCASTCNSDRRCASWSFVNTAAKRAKKSCELKSNVGKAESNPSSISGISARIEKNYQPSMYRSTALLGSRTQPTGTTTRTTTTRRVTSSATSHTPTVRTRTVSPQASVTTRTVKRVAAPAAPAKVTASKTVTRPATAAPAKINAVPARDKPVTVTSRATPAAQTTQAAPTSRVVLTAPTKPDTSSSVNGRVVLTGDMAATTGGGVGKTPAAPIPRNVPVNKQGERVPYKNLSSREYPDYSVTQAAEQGSIEGVSGEAGS